MFHNSYSPEAWISRCGDRHAASICPPHKAVAILFMLQRGRAGQELRQMFPSSMDMLEVHYRRSAYRHSFKSFVVDLALGVNPLRVENIDPARAGKPLPAHLKARVMDYDLVTSGTTR